MREVVERRRSERDATRRAQRRKVRVMVRSTSGSRITLTALLLVVAGCGGDGPSRSRVQAWADALAAGEACSFVCAHRDQLTRRCAEQSAFVRAHASTLPGGKVSVGSFTPIDGGTKVVARVTGTSARGTSSVSVTFACDEGRDTYPSSCPSRGPDAWWVFEVTP